SVEAEESFCAPVEPARMSAGSSSIWEVTAFTGEAGWAWTAGTAPRVRAVAVPRAVRVRRMTGVLNSWRGQYWSHTLTRRVRSVLLRYDVDRDARALLRADTAALAVVVLELVLAGCQLGHRIVRADGEAVVAAEAVAARHAAAGLEEGGDGIEALHDLVEGGGTTCPFE